MGLILILLPLTALASGFAVGRVRQPPIRMVGAVLVIALPLIWAIGLHPNGFALGFALVLFSLHIGLWMFFSAVGVVAGTATRPK